MRTPARAHAANARSWLSSPESPLRPLRPPAAQRANVRGWRCLRGEYRDTVIAADTGEVLPEPGKDFFGYEIAPLRGAEDAMNEDVRVVVGHGREYPHSLNARLCRLSHSDGAVPKRDSRCPALPTRHFHAGLSHAVPSALELAPRGENVCCHTVS